MTPPPPSPATRPEAEARVEIDAALEAASWVVQNRAETDPTAAFTATHGQIGRALLGYPELIAKEPEQCTHDAPAARWRKR